MKQSQVAKAPITQRAITSKGKPLQDKRMTRKKQRNFKANVILG